MSRDEAPSDADLIASIERSLAEAKATSGSQLACRIGCTECCIGPFPITWLDAARLRLGLASLASRDAARGGAIVARAQRAVARLREGFPGDAAGGWLGDDDEAEEAFCARHAALACPAVAPASGRSELYEARPISCRTYGPSAARTCRPAVSASSPPTRARSSAGGS